MKRIVYFLILFPFFVFAQKKKDDKTQELSLTGHIRPRVEYKNYLAGHPSLDPILIASQRTRLSLGYKNPAKDFNTMISLQDTRVWGNSDQQASSDNSSLNIFEAWGEVFLSQSVSFKLGRQELVYDDGRILGQSEFSQIGRSHDAALFKLSTGKFRMHIGGAFNTNATKSSQAYDIEYGLQNYKTMQFAHFQYKTKKLKLSALLFNNGLEYIADEESEKEILYSQTIGANLDWTFAKGLTFHLLGYHQMGRDHADKKLNTNNLKATLEYWPLPKKLSFTAGFDFFSGNPNDLASNENRSFTPIYGGALLHLGMAGIYLVPFSRGQYSENPGVTKYLLETKLIHKKWIIWNRFYAYNAQNDLYDADMNKLKKYMGLEEELFIIYRHNKHVMLQGIIGLFNMSDNTKKGMSHPALGDYTSFEDWQSWFIFEISFRPSFFVKKWDK